MRSTRERRQKTRIWRTTYVGKGGVYVYSQMRLAVEDSRPSLAESNVNKGNQRKGQKRWNTDIVNNSC